MTNVLSTSFGMFRFFLLLLYQSLAQWVECSPMIRETLVQSQGSIPGRVIQKTFKIVLDNFLLNTQQYKVRIEGEVGKSRERSSALPYTLV